MTRAEGEVRDDGTHIPTERVEHPGCPYLAVMVENGWWICTKCGKSGEVPKQ